MPDAIATASVLVRPDLTGFKTSLAAQLKEIQAKTKPLRVAVTPVVAKGAKGSLALNQATEKSLKTQTVLTRQVAKEESLVSIAKGKRLAVEAELNAVQEVAARGGSAVAVAEREIAQGAKAAAAAQEFMNAAIASGNSLQLQAAERLTLQAEATIALGQADLKTAKDALALAAADREQALAAAKTARANEAAAAAQAHRQAQLTRGAAATGLSTLGIRGATLAAGGPFLAGAAAVTVFVKAIEAAAAHEESLAAVTTLLGTALTEKLAASADEASTSLGLVSAETLRFEASLAQIFKSFGVGDAQIVRFGSTLTQVAADIAAFRDVDITTVFNAIQSALLGNTRGLRSLGVALTAADVQQRALSDSGKAHAADLTNQEKALARYELILARTAGLSGAAAQATGRLSGQGRILKAQITQLGVSIGTGLIPFLTVAIKDLNVLARVAEKAGHQLKRLGDSVPLGPLGSFKKDILIASIPLFGPFIEGARLLAGAMDTAGNAATNAFLRYKAFFDLISSQGGFFLSGLKAPKFKPFLTGQESLADQITRAEIGGSVDDQLKLLDQQQKALEQGLTRVAPGSKKSTALLGKLAASQAQEQSIRDGLAADAKSAAKDAASAAKDALQAIDEANQAFVDAFAPKEARIQLRVTRAEGTKNLRDDTKAAVEERNFLIGEVASLKARIKLELGRGHAVKILTDALETVRQNLAEQRNTVKSLFKEQADARKERRAARRDALIESIQLDIDFSHEAGSVGAEIKSRQALIKVLKKAQDGTKRGTVEYKKWRNLIQEQKKAIDELRKAEKDKAKSGASLAFEFLQNQQGFAANLLSNIVPGLSIAGTVGGHGSGAGEIPGGGGGGTSGGVSGGGGLLGAGAALGAASGGMGGSSPVTFGAAFGAGLGLTDSVSKSKAQKATGDIGPTRGQQITQTDLLRRILRELHGIRLGRTHPSAASQRRSAAATGDIYGV